MTELLYKQDWETAQQHYLAWWAGEPFERCALAVTAPRDDRKDLQPPETPEDPVQYWTDLEYISALNHYQHETTFYGGEAFPTWHGNGFPGHTSLPAYLDSPVTLDMATGWWDPIFTTEEWDVSGLRFDPENPWWKFTLAQLQRGMAEAPGKFIPDVGAALSGCGDVLDALIGSNQLLLDVSLKPDQVRDAEFHLLDLWFQAFDPLYAIASAAGMGTTTWFRLWSPGRFYPTSCDFSYMISPKMFRSLFLPVIERWTNGLDHSIYHVDGVGSFNHLPALTEMPKLQAFQILPGAGKPSPLHYLDTLRYVQSRGKNLQISIAPQEVETALSLLSSRGLFIETQCESEAEARYLLKMAEKWSHV
jgi:hypothetical protein